jgi:hypothetical protein
MKLTDAGPRSLNSGLQGRAIVHRIQKRELVGSLKLECFLDESGQNS